MRILCIHPISATTFVGKGKPGILDSSENPRDKKCLNLSFTRSITLSRQDVLRDPLHDRDPLDRALEN